MRLPTKVTQMRLADFIELNVEEIVSACEEFARTFPAGTGLSSEELRNHIPLILGAIAKDLRTAQTSEEEFRKSLGQMASATAPETAAQTHALLRAKVGFSIEQLVAEYRALRASVLRLWAKSHSQAGPEALADIVRFGEAIDQAVAESVVRFSSEIDRMRHVFLGVLGHDLRGPLNAILLTSRVMALHTSADSLVEHTDRLIRSGERMRTLLDDLLDYSRISLGVGIRLQRGAVDLAPACQEELDMLRSALPGRSILFETKGSTQGNFDASRIREALGNLVQNAASYADPGTPIVVRLDGDEAAVTLSVENAGPPISQEALKDIFEPLTRGDNPTESEREREHLGLGLYIVSEIAKAHGGSVDVESLGRKTTFRLSLRRSGT